ncbi:MAG: hypothetical protein A2857_00035 [Candidatus Levybacteria bacterium RIFCSPHIGHO2_01_FULL_36_15]|nr:MAG: hypothetical protein A2857_00035 [Candidatus Levybacteria bacterium RIFCSPHIGHO2_01_FULL_36_15]OGH36935.1 MAG: hypothetical protein A2905_00955 [Candidatus Levybacteria bacterium RIFCSPLOWO2_01_FULL_36_10]
MKSVILDTNGFLRLLLNDNPEQADKVENLIKKAEAGQVNILVPQIIIFEINFILEKYYLLEKEEILEKLKSLASASYFVVESRDIFIRAFSLYKQNNVSLVDCFLVAKAFLEKAKLFTFDQKLHELQG